MASRSTQSFILPRSIKEAPEISGELMVKRKMPPCSGSVALRQLKVIELNKFNRANEYAKLVIQAGEYYILKLV